MPIDVAKLLAASLPKTFNIVNGDSIAVPWHDADEDFARPAAPYATFKQLSRAPARDRVDREDIPTTANATQNFTFVTGTDDYQVTERDIVSITSITGTRSGSPHTFSASTDYEAVATDDYATKNVIRWKIGGNKPDNGTQFTVTYAHRVIDLKVASRSRITYRLTLHVGALASGVSGATRAYGKMELARFLEEALVKELMVQRAKNLSGTGDLIIGRFQNFGILPIDGAESLARVVVDLQLNRHQRETEETVKTIGKSVASYTAEL